MTDPGAAQPRTSQFRGDIRAANPEPRRDDFDTVEAYLAAWRAWRAWNREHELNPAESEARHAVVEAEIARRARNRRWREV